MPKDHDQHHQGNPGDDDGPYLDNRAEPNRKRRDNPQPAESSVHCGFHG